MNKSGRPAISRVPVQCFRLSPLSVPFINLTQYDTVVLSDSSIRNSVRHEIYGVRCKKGASSAKSHTVLFFSSQSLWG